MRRRNKRDIVIELTSLLDVIMIIIFMVMKQNSGMIVEKQNTIDEVRQTNSQQAADLEELNSRADELSSQLEQAQEKLEEGGADELREKLRDAENKLAGYQAVDDVVIVLNIGLENNSGNSVRRLTYGKAAYGEPAVITENHSDEEFEVSLNKLRVFIGDYINKVIEDKSNQTIVYIVFTYDPDKVYQRDYKAVGAALENADKNANNGNFRYRINPI